ncbi:VOC family protein [Nocardioides zeae]|uniref:VOC family protein n=1 Tax=Nocardioides imazamoxiresistens TaxID=3231893 RepID=A0ABU3PSN8_9ACTN|nr:VOC family protein [Nocardioides zeae]MDT9592240.1 VOC family protein [Nocardioides zeae]
MSNTNAPRLWLTLQLRDVPATTAWLEAIGFTEHVTHRDDTGVVVHAEYLWPAGGGVMLGAAERAGGQTDWVQQPGGAAAYLVVADTDATFAAAVAAGGTVHYEPVDRDFGGREAAVRDPDGNLWSFGTYAPGA